ncbi:integral peroxisomal membrane peroxin-domain-containing protein [Zychaea mexicana]|uniref:integral peroxisomal membrane peroxin-domain-containing protein n=1 Tax=Zychaea mexicana TaxID=64656 RepID=UPI0022FE6C3B|nr:integral peroxisomal membrane peroxin-domain-containing protein [Zychaea mexicana]KAI9492986.1 integral peroxisomal membrane peroxin-domain-containing protein [Zychaea mexicana]
MPISHSFKRATFLRPTYCQYCSKFLWGVAQQGVQCSECDYVAHYHCQDNAPAECHATQQKEKRTPAENSLLHIQQKLKGSETIQQPSSSFAPIASSDGARHKQRQQREEKRPVNHIMRSLQDLVVSAALEASDNYNQPSVSEYLSNQPPLQPHTTAKNFTKFVTRCSIVFDIRNAVVLLLCWDDPVNTWIAVLVYSILCCYPKVLLIVPQCVLLYFVLSESAAGATTASNSNNINHVNTTTFTVSSQSSPSTENINRNNNKSRSESPANSSDKTRMGSPKNIASTPGGSLTATLVSLLTSQDGTPEYRNNLQNIQNMMGEYVFIHDQIIVYRNRYVRTDNANITIQLLVVSMAMTMATVRFISLNYIFLACGWFAFVINLPFVKVCLRRVRHDHSATKDVIAVAAEKTMPVQKWYKRQTSRQPCSDYRTVSVYENQTRRKEAERDDTPVFVEDPLVPWSNLYGTTQLSVPEQVDPPEGYRWKQSDHWAVDKTGPWIDELLQIGIAMKISF